MPNRAFIASVVLLCAFISPLAAAIELIAAENQAWDFPTVKGMQYLSKLASDRSGGEVKIKVVAEARLGSEKEVLEQVRKGSIAMARVNVGALSAVVPEAAVLSMPFLFRNVKHEQKVLEGPLGKELLAEISKNDLVALCYYDSGFRSFYTTKKQIRSLEDMKGLRIRVQESEMLKSFVSSLGAIPVPMAYGSVGEALRAGTIDGAENNWSSYISTGHYESARFYTVSNHIIAPDVVVISRKVWNALSPSQQQVIVEAANESTSFTRDAVEKREAEDIAKAQTAGVIVTQMYLPLDRQPFVLAVRPVFDKYLSTPKLQQFALRIRNTH